MRVLMIGPGRNVQGGISTVVNQYYEAELDKKVELKYIATMQDGNKIIKLAVAIKAMLEFRSIAEEYEVLHVHMSARASFWRKSKFIEYAYSKGLKIIIHMHGSEFDVFYDQECDDEKKKKIKKIFEMSDKVIALSEEWKSFLTKICDSSKIVIIYNAVKVPEYIRKDFSDHNILFLGRLGKRKGTYDLLEAVPKVIESIPDAHFFLGGDGEIEECQVRCKDSNIESYVTLMGWVSGKEKEEKLKSCSVFVLPSYHEGMPMAILEAMSFGELTVSTYVGGIPKVISDGYNGFLFQAGDVDKLAKILIDVLENADKKRIIARNGYDTILNKFDASIMAEEVNNLYEEVLLT